MRKKIKRKENYERNVRERRGVNEYRVKISRTNRQTNIRGVRKLIIDQIGVLS